jgi:hypothetical protein
MGFLNTSGKGDEEVWPRAPHIRRSLRRPLFLSHRRAKLSLWRFPLLVLTDADSGFPMLESCGANALVRSPKASGACKCNHRSKASSPSCLATVQPCKQPLPAAV